jgi:hypothetical protein
MEHQGIQRWPPAADGPGSGRRYRPGATRVTLRVDGQGRLVGSLAEVRAKNIARLSVTRARPGLGEVAERSAAGCRIRRCRYRARRRG